MTIKASIFAKSFSGKSLANEAMDHKDGISEKSIALEYVHFVSTECSNFRNNYTL